MEEYWDIYDENRVFQGRTIKRGEAFRDGEYYVCCDVWIVNSKGEMLVTLRHPDKKAGGLWEFVGGGVLAGETTREAAVREVEEEIGISLLPNELSLLHVYKNRNYFMDVYLVRKDVDIHSLVLAPEETVDAKWVSKEDFRRMIENKEVVYSVSQRYNLLEKLL